MRSIVFTSLILVIVVTVATYVGLSLPFVNAKFKSEIEEIASNYLGGKVTIEEFEIKPFNEIQLYGLSIFEPSGERCISVGKLGAGISIWQLMINHKIELNYLEVISLNANLTQMSKDSPLNINFIIEALKGKENQEKTDLDINLRNVVIRKSSISFDKKYVNPDEDTKKIDFNHLEIKNLNADLALPVISKDLFVIDLRRLAFQETSGFTLKNLSFLGTISQEQFSINKLKVQTPHSNFKFSNISLPVNGLNNILNCIISSNLAVQISANPLCLSDFSSFLPILSSADDLFEMSIDYLGTIDDFLINEFKLSNIQNSSFIEGSGKIENCSKINSLIVDVDRFKIDLKQGFIEYLKHFITISNPKINRLLTEIKDVTIETVGTFDNSNKSVEALVDFNSNIGDVLLSSKVDWKNSIINLNDFSTKISNIDLGNIVENPKIGLASADISGNFSITKSDINGNVLADIHSIDFNSHRFENIFINAEKIDNHIVTDFKSEDSFINLTANIDFLSEHADSELNVKFNVNKIYTNIFLNQPLSSDNIISFKGEGNLIGDNIDNIRGDINIHDIIYKTDKSFNINNLSLNVNIENELRKYCLSSDFMEGKLTGNFLPSHLFSSVAKLIYDNLPFLKKYDEINQYPNEYADLEIEINPDAQILKDLPLPVNIPVPINLNSHYSGSDPSVNLTIDAPYLVKGNKLIKDTRLNLSFDTNNEGLILVKSLFPIKNNYADLQLLIKSSRNYIQGDLDWTMSNNKSDNGQLKLQANILSDALGSVQTDMSIMPSSFHINGADWIISGSDINFNKNLLSVNDLKIYCKNQFIEIKGRTSDSPLDILTVDLANINLDYIFDILNINHVNFGGLATGQAHITKLFSKSPVAMTDNLTVKDLRYNGCLFGDGEIEAHWDNAQKKIAINADIDSDSGSSATVRGGIYIAKDSLSFDFGAHKVDASFLKPFIKTFSSDIKGRASGNVKLYGTFADVDLSGKAVADSVSLLIDYTNVYYTASDSIFFKPGLIEIPNLKLSDKYGNTANLNGVIRHDFLRDASFDFKINDLNNMLVYDTNSSFNPIWYGSIFASGNASILGVPGSVDININVSTSKNSNFTFVLDENETALNYSFITFTDKRKQEITEIDLKAKFEEELINKSPVLTEDSIPDIFSLDLLLEVTSDATMNIIMDPKAGDKISSNGKGALQIQYSSETDKLNLFGKYSILEGNYNFSLQDLILRNFNIREGSSITFNGDPLRGILDISAAYRVNANLADLDESFKTDPDLNRTSIPVDALLLIKGELESPEINFDLDMPTVTTDVRRRVRSIVSTEDMMNQQMIYLLALNRFYSPEYTSSQQGGELASVASSTISSQIQNIIGSVTDKFSLAPSFRSDKDNFSDMEVDLALSSQLFDNRLVLNGNLGYRDKSTSQTTFIGDFDIEYLLSRDGRFRVKAYNHFNDASYYLKSALTTQGVGLIYRKEFDEPFKFLNRSRRTKQRAKKSYTKQRDTKP